MIYYKLFFRYYRKFPTSCIGQSFLNVIKLCAPEKVASLQALIDDTINPDISYQKQPLDLRNQRTFAVKVSRISRHSKKASALNNVQAGANGLLDVARQRYKEANKDAYQLVTRLGGEFIRLFGHHGLMQQKKFTIYPLN